MRLHVHAIVLAATAAACSQYDGGHRPSGAYSYAQVPVTEYVTGSATMSNAIGLEHVAEGDAIPPPASGPAALVSSPQAVLPGGAALFGVSSDTPFDTIYVGVPGAYGYWEVPVVAATEESVVLTIPQDIPSTFALTFALSAGGVMGPAVTSRLTRLPVGTGPVQVSLTFDQPTDVDLYLVEPTGEEIYYGDKTSSAGGRLDLDANAGCSTSAVYNENITYESASPPQGTYTVRVNYWSHCNLAQPTRYVVTVVVDGVVATYFGVLSPPGQGGGSGAGEVVATFTY